MDTPAPHPPLTIFIVDDNLDVDLMRWVLEAHAATWIYLLENGLYRV
jgi:hypothetical protein